MSLSGAGTLCQIGLRKKFELKLSNNSIFGGLKCNCQFGYILCLLLDYFNKFLCIISNPNLNGGNVSKFHVRNVPNFEVRNVPNLKLGNCIQSIITPPGPGATIQKSRDSLAVQSPILAGVCNASNIIPKVLPETGKQTLKIRSKYARNA